MSYKVAIVTGSNKGIGFAIVKALCQRFDGTVYLTCRDEERGREAVEQLKKLGLNPQFHQLDVTNVTSVERFGDYLKKHHEGIDILINNAGISPVSFKPTFEECKRIIETNYKGVILVQDHLFPLLRNNARVLNISSDCGHLSNLRSQYWIDKLSSKDLKKSDVDAFVDWYLDSVSKGTYKAEDFADGGKIVAYRVSKVAVSALTVVQQKEVASRGVSVNSLHPGLVSTDMTMGIGFLTPDEAAKTPVYLVVDAPDSLKGAYIWYDGKELDWFNYKADYYFKTKSIRDQLIKDIIKYPLKLVSFSHIGVAMLSLFVIYLITYLFS